MSDSQVEARAAIGGADPGYSSSQGCIGDVFDPVRERVLVYRQGGFTQWDTEARRAVDAARGL